MTKEEILNKLESRFGGVYALLDKGVCVYVGQSSNIPSRLHQHLREGVKDFDDYRIYFCKNRKQLESDMIRILRPKYNIMENNWVESYTLEEQQTSCRREIDKVADVLRQNHSPIECRVEDLKRVFTEEYGVRPPYKEILERYGGYLGKDSLGDKFCLLTALRFKKQIQQDIFEYAFSKSEWI